MELDEEAVEENRKEGFAVYLGDASQIETLRMLGVERASSVIITVENEVTLKRTAKIISTNFPDLPIIVRTKDLSNSVNLYQYGATIIVPETYETGLQLGGAVLKSVGISEFEVSRIKNQFRAGNYVMAKDPDEITEEENDETLGYDYMGHDLIDAPEYAPKPVHLTADELENKINLS